jgi:hypothetical protein
MSLLLKENEVCKYSSGCPYNSGVSPHAYCMGANPNRNKSFICDLVSDSGTFTENKFRSAFDETGKMKVLMEDNKR